MNGDPQETSVEAPPAPRPAQELWKRYHQQADTQAENALVIEYLPLVRTAAARLAMTLPEHVDADDLHSAGLVGLLQALRNFDPACGASLESYARLRIRGAMLDELRRMDWVPRTVHEKARRVQETMTALEQKLGRAASEAEMAGALNLSADQYSELLDEIRPAAFVCLDSTASLEGGEAGSLYSLVADTSSDGPVEEVSRRELKRIVFDRLKKLPEMQRKVLGLYYGEDLHLREIAQVFNLTESRICQIHAQAVLAIRAHLQRYEAGLATAAPSIRRA